MLPVPTGTMLSFANRGCWKETTRWEGIISWSQPACPASSWIHVASPAPGNTPHSPQHSCPLTWACSTVFSEKQLPWAAFPGALWGELQIDFKGVKFEQVHQHRARSGDSIICRIAQQLLCQSVDHSQDLYKLPPLALVDTLLQHSSSFLGVVSALYPLSCLLRRLICFLLATHSLCKSHCG